MSNRFLSGKPFHPAVSLHATLGKVIIADLCLLTNGITWKGIQSTELIRADYSAGDLVVQFRFPFPRPHRRRIALHLELHRQLLPLLLLEQCRLPLPYPDGRRCLQVYALLKSQHSPAHLYHSCRMDIWKVGLSAIHGLLTTCGIYPILVLRPPCLRLSSMFGW
jgi:hypothetical protein